MSNPSSKKIEGEIDRFDDIFHAHGDDIDEHEDADIDFDQFFTDFDKNDDEHEPTNIPLLGTTAEEESETKAEEEEEEEEEHEHLSQKLSQLATSNIEPAPTTTAIAIVKKRSALTPTTPTSSLATTKKFKPESNKAGVRSEKEEKIPKYLSQAEKTFEEIITPLLPQAAAAGNNTVVFTEELRQMALLEHKVQVLNLDVLLWTTYLQSGTGKLKEEEDRRSILQQLQYPKASYPCIWPKKLKASITADPNVPPQDKTNLDHRTCLNYVNRMLAQFQEQLLFYQEQIQERRQHLKSDLTLEMEQVIINFVEEHGVALYRIVIEGQIAAVEYNYADRMLDLEFQQEDSFREHINVFQILTKSKTAKETAKMEVELLKQRVAHHQLSSLFESFQLPPPAALETIEDQANRQRLIYRYEQLVQRTKSEMMVIHIRAAEMKMDESNKQYDADFKEFYQKQRASHSTTKFTQKMFNIMDRRFQVVDERLKTLYDLKVRFFVKAPTVNKS